MIHIIVIPKCAGKTHYLENVHCNDGIIVRTDFTSSTHRCHRTSAVYLRLPFYTMINNEGYKDIISLHPSKIDGFCGECNVSKLGDILPIIASSTEPRV